MIRLGDTIRQTKEELREQRQRLKLMDQLEDARARKMLRTILYEKKPTRIKDVRMAARIMEIPWRNVQRARRQLEVSWHKGGWILPRQPPPEAVSLPPTLEG